MLRAASSARPVDHLRRDARPPFVTVPPPAPVSDPAVRRNLIPHDLQTLIVGALRAADALLVVLAALGSYWIRHDDLDVPDLYVISIIVAVVLTANYMQIAGLYVFDNLGKLAVQLGRLAVSWTAVVLTLVAFAYFTQTSIAFSRAFVLGRFALSFAGFILVRLLLLRSAEHTSELQSHSFIS